MRLSATQSGNINTRNINAENITQNPGLEKIDVIMKNEAFNVLFSQIMDDTVGKEAKMIICFIKNVSSLLALVSAVRENNFERHSQAECEMVKYCFAFYHINFARYVSYQQVYLRELQCVNSNAMVNLMQRGFGGSLSCDLFFCLHGVFITEIFNGQTKRQAIPHCAEFSTESLKLTHGLLHLISMKNLGKLFRRKYN